jgi:TonB family protein
MALNVDSPQSGQSGFVQQLQENRTTPTTQHAKHSLHHEPSALSSAVVRRRHTFVGSVLSLFVLVLLLWLVSLADITPYAPVQERVSIPITLLQFGIESAETSNQSAKGNLTEEGAAKQASITPELLEDAQTAFAKPEKIVPKPREYTQPSFVQPVQEKIASSTRTEEERSSVQAAIDVGVVEQTTTRNAEALSRFGSGTGSGTGFNLEWGTGGNRLVMHKELPKYPAGINTSAQIKIRFTVLPNGSVGIILPLQKGEPALERVAMEALRRWQFNPIADTKEMAGIITFTFRVQ